MPFKTTDSQEISHLWANSVPCLETAKGSEPHESRNTSREHFTADNVPAVQRYWSYSTIVAAKHVLRTENVYLITSGYYSVTTSKHVRWAQQSVPGGFTFHVPRVLPVGEDDHTRNVESIAAQGIEDAQYSVIEHAKLYCSLFKVKRSSLDKKTRRYLRMNAERFSEVRTKEIEAENAQKRIDAIEAAKETKERRTLTLRRFLNDYSIYVLYNPESILKRFTGWRPLQDVHNALGRSHNRDGFERSDWEAVRAVSSSRRHFELCSFLGTENCSYNVLRDRATQILSEVNGQATKRKRLANFCEGYRRQYSKLQSIFRTYTEVPEVSANASWTERESERVFKQARPLALILPEGTGPEAANRLRERFRALPSPDASPEVIRESEGLELYDTILRYETQYNTRKTAHNTRVRERAELLRNAEKIERWKAGENVSIPYGVPMMLRLRGTNVQTSQHASIPIRIAKVLWKALKTRNIDALPARIGHFSLNRSASNADTLVVGCHRIPMAEIDRIAPEVLAYVEPEVMI